MSGGETCSAVALSLNSLLEYTYTDEGEASAEVIIVAELFQDMLDQHYGQDLLQWLAAVEKQVSLASGAIYAQSFA